MKGFSSTFSSYKRNWQAIRFTVEQFGDLGRIVDERESVQGDDDRPSKSHLSWVSQRKVKEGSCKMIDSILFSIDFCSDFCRGRSRQTEADPQPTSSSSDRETTLVDLKERTQKSILILKVKGFLLQIITIVAEDFVHLKSSARFESLKTALLNGIKAYPKTLQEAYVMAGWPGRCSFSQQLLR
jgi:hypothetical protein